MPPRDIVRRGLKHALRCSYMVAIIARLLGVLSREIANLPW